MSNSYFKFKQFTIQQEGAAMKVGTDGVMLGAWADITNVKSALDIGTGSGVIALMLAQRCDAKVDAVEIDADSANQAKANALSSPWKSRVSIFQASFQDFYINQASKYDLIVSNPPYFSRSLKSPLRQRNLTRHADELPNNDLIEGVGKLLKPDGRFCAVFPYAEGNIFIAQAANSGLFCIRKLNVKSGFERPVLRMLTEFSFDRSKLYEDTISIHSDSGEFTLEYKTLTGDFYLSF